MRHRGRSSWQWHLLLLLLLSLFASLRVAAAADASDSAAAVETEDCNERCGGFGTWVYGRGWLVPPYQTDDIGECLQRGLAEPGWEDEANGGNGRGGQADLVQEAMVRTYGRVLEGGVVNRIGTTVGEAEAALAVAANLNAASEGATVPNSEGLYYCLKSPVTNETAFYWVINCDLLEEIGSPDLSLCDGLTEAEEAAALSSPSPVRIGYVVDDGLLGTSGKVFHRYLFNETGALRTESQPISGPTGFECSGRPWFVQNWSCQDPTAVSCPTYFVGSSGIGAFQTYGSTDTAVVAQDIRDYQLCVCLEDMPCDPAEREDDESGLSSLALGIMIGVLVFFAVGIVCSFRGRIKRNKLFRYDA